MAIDPLTFSNPTAYSAVDWSPLANLGKALQQQQSLDDLAKLYQAPQPQSSASYNVGMVPSAGGTSAPFAAPPTSGDVNAAIKATAAAAGMDVPTWKAIASIESSLNAGSNSDRPTQYKGLFQIGSDEWKRHGKGNIYDAEDNASAAANLAQENNTWFKKQFGRDPTPVETYMMHQQGTGFYANGTVTNVAGNPYPGMSGPQTPKSFEEGWGREIERRAKYFRNSETADTNGD